VRVVRLRPEARRDLLEISEYLLIESGSEAVSARFLAAVESTLSLLAEHPLIGTRYVAVPVDLAGLRAFVVSAFPHYMVFYLPVDKAVDVIRVLHGARDLARLLEEG